MYGQCWNHTFSLDFYCVIRDIAASIISLKLQYCRVGVKAHEQLEVRVSPGFFISIVSTMGRPGKPDEAVLFLALAFPAETDREAVHKLAVEPFGRVRLQSPCFPFKFSDYYATEMGADLVKMFVVFENLYPIEQAVQTKLRAIEIEQQTSCAGRRTVNLDPGYLTLAKLVMTTTKNFDHRLYLGNGIFGDVQLRYRNGEFVTNPWTYPDYREAHTHSFLHEARDYLCQLVKQHEAHL